MLALKNTLSLSCRILQYFWVLIGQILNEKHEELTSLGTRASKKQQLYQTLWTVTDALRNFFQAEGSGLTEEQINTNEFRVRFSPNIYYSTPNYCHLMLHTNFHRDYRIQSQRFFSLALRFENKVQLSSWQKS